MLILSRQDDEDTVLTVPPSDKPTVIRHRQIEVRGDKVRHGWSAPDVVIIDRGEVHEAKKREAAINAELAQAAKLVKV